MCLHPGPIEAKSQCIGSIGLKLLGKSGDLGEVHIQSSMGNACFGVF